MINWNRANIVCLEEELNAEQNGIGINVKHTKSVKTYEKTRFCHVQTTKVEISLPICAV